MNQKFEIIEVTKENKNQYLRGIVQLEEMVLERMEQEGRVGQLFITGIEDLQEYVESKCNHVMVAVRSDDDKQIISTTYITQGQVDYTYNDVTKYFKCDGAYESYIKSKYSQEEFERVIRLIYIEKICAFKYARDAILSEHGVECIPDIKEKKRNDLFLELVEKERSNPENQFHEKSEIRDNLNKYMSLYMKYVKKNLKQYQDFYWVDLDYIAQHSKRQQTDKGAKHSRFDSTMETYDKILQYLRYKVYDRNHCQDISKYFNATPENTIELDTYITRPDCRENGIARILVLEGLKKSIKMLLQNEENKEIFLVSTLHADNLSSKYVSEFFGLKDYLFVNRRSGRDRQVHIFGIAREDAVSYIERMEKKVAVLYDYNPNHIDITTAERTEILEEQLAYEKSEFERLNGIKDEDEKKKFVGYIRVKRSKIDMLGNTLEQLRDCGLENRE